MTLPLFPTSLLRERSIMYELVGQTISGGQSISGLMPMTRIDGGGVWRAILAEIQLRTADQVRTWRAMTAICDGGAQPIIVPMCDRRHFPAPTVNGVRITGGHVPYSDGTTHSDGTEFDQSVIVAEVGGPVALRGTTMDITFSQGGELKGGEYFSIEHIVASHRLYRIATAIQLNSVSWRVTIRPPLREAIEAEDVLEFDNPRCVMRLATPNAMDIALEQRKWGNADVAFIEAFPPFPE